MSICVAIRTSCPFHAFVYKKIEYVAPTFEHNESFAGNKTIISYNLEDRQKLNMKTILNNIFNLKIKMIQKTSWLSPLMHVIVSIGIGVAIGYGSHLIITKQITSGNFVSFITALILLYTPIKNGRIQTTI